MKVKAFITFYNQDKQEIIERGGYGDGNLEWDVPTFFALTVWRVEEGTIPTPFGSAANEKAELLYTSHIFTLPDRNQPGGIHSFKWGGMSWAYDLDNRELYIHNQIINI